jgi:hypothetical protein
MSFLKRIWKTVCKLTIISLFLTSLFCCFFVVFYSLVYYCFLLVTPYLSCFLSLVFVFVLFLSPSFFHLFLLPFLTIFRSFYVLYPFSEA